MERADSVATPHSRWVYLFGTAFLYFLAGKFALLLAVPPGYASPIWPAAGFPAMDSGERGQGGIK